ncbi:hypothetical protein KEM54_005309 [Ascosphaera aggregata]|nr:hypothetical protein KEM54_005309 [Ascosphaera aggregata]
MTTECRLLGSAQAGCNMYKRDSIRIVSRLRLMPNPFQFNLRVAFLCSDFVLSVDPSIGKKSQFTQHLDALKRANVKNVNDSVAEVYSLSAQVDPLLSAFPPLTKENTESVSVVTPASILLSSIPHLYRLSSYPIVIHVVLGSSPVDQDHSIISAIRECGFTFLKSEGLTEAVDIAVTAHAVAKASGKGVIHFFEDVGTQEVIKIDVEFVKNIISNVNVNGSTTQAREDSLYVDSGRTVTFLEEQHAYGQELAESIQPTEAITEKATTPEAISSTNSSAPSQAGEATSIAVPSSTTTVEPTLSSRPLNSDDIVTIVLRIWNTISILTERQRTYNAIEYIGPKNAEYAIFTFGGRTSAFTPVLDKMNQTGEFRVGLVNPRLYRPFSAKRVAEVIPSSVKKIAVLEQTGAKRRMTRWGACFLDLLAGFNDSLSGESLTGSTKAALVAYRLVFIDTSSDLTVRQAMKGILQNLSSDSPIQNLEVGQSPTSLMQTNENPHQPAHENAYTKILNQIFEDRLYIANEATQIQDGNGLRGGMSTRPEFGIGAILAREERRKDFVQHVKAAVAQSDDLAEEVKVLLTKWAVSVESCSLDTFHHAKQEKLDVLGKEIIYLLEKDSSSEASALLSSGKQFLKQCSQWLIGSDAWSYDLGNSAVHHILSLNLDVNMLVIDSTPYSERSASDAHRRKKDIGLYAMNFGNAYVASVAVYASYTQVLHAIAEAEQFNGPSVVVAYLPWVKEDDSALEILKETKRAVDVGYWPLYRWDPSPTLQPGGDDGSPIFTLDSERIRRDLQKFLERDNQLTQLARRKPLLASSLDGSYGTDVRKVQKRVAKNAYAKLLEGLYGAPLTILFASDNGNAENLAKRLGNRGKARGLKTLVMSMDDYPLEDLPTEENVVFITSTAGQGEFPQNGRAFWDAIKACGDIDLSGVKYSVFGLGDSEYWPRKEDKIFYNKPGKDLDARLEFIGGKRLAPLRLGDDQDPDGFQTGYSEWEPLLWKELGVDKVEGLPVEPPPKTNEDIKAESNYLRGTIVEGLQDTSTLAISASDQQLTKFHGTYMQDDRDLREARKAEGLEPAYAFMIRCRLPGGVATPQQWVQMDDISSAYGNETMKLTTRQTFQFHGVVKGRLRAAMRAINRAMMTTLAACGDVNRNVMCSSLPELSAFHREVYAVSKKISDHLLPSTTAYHEIWLKDDNNKKVQVGGDAVVDHEPLYGPTYLPRKFKITIAVPPHNDTDVYAHDVGLIAIKGDDGKLAGFNLLAGGGMGVTHNNKRTYPRTGSMFGFVQKEHAHTFCEKIMLVQRDFGDRKNRKHARLKYTIDDMGVEAFKNKVEELLPAGVRFEEPRPFKFTSNVDTFGWVKDEAGLNHFTFFIENGRIEDTADFKMRTGLRELAQMDKGEFRLTGNQHLILSNISDADLPAIKEHLAKYKLDNTGLSGLRLSSSACVGFPTCGLAMAESERYLPVLIDKLESYLEEYGLSRESIVMRVTGCPNGCARPWLAEVGLVGKAYGAYNLYLGGGYQGQRLNKLYRASIKEEEILEIMKSLLKRYVSERLDAKVVGGLDGENGRPERFGDWCIRSGIIKPTTEGKEFHDDVAVEDEGEE